MAARLARRIVGRSVAFYAANFVNLLLPLVSVPYLTRTLGPTAWGELAMAQAVATVLAVLVDYGHAQSGTRALLGAASGGEAGRMAGAILAAKLWLGVVGAAALVLLAALGIVPSRPDLLAGALAAGIALGLSPLWLAQAGDGIGRFLAVDVTMKAASVAGLFLFVHGPADVARVLWLQAGASGLAVLGGLLLAPVRPAPPIPRPAETARLLLEQRHGFLFRATILTYTTANTLVLGLVASAHEVGIFAAADRAVRLVACFAGPLGQALYPVLARTFREDPAAAARLAGRATLGVVGIGAALGLGLFVAADTLAPRLLGAAFADSASVLRVLAPLPLLICVSNLLGIQWMFSIGAESAFVRILALAGAVCLPTGAVLGTALGADGMAGAATLAECVVTGGILVHLARNKSLPSPVVIGSRAHAH